MATPEEPVSFLNRDWDRSKPDFRTAYGSINIKNMTHNPIDGERTAEVESLHN
jgi:hypothetical protein